MNPLQMDIFNLAEQRLAWTDRRQAVLAQNVANADTPGWRSRDIDPFAKILAGKETALAPVQTAPGHIAGQAPEQIMAARAKGETAPDGNGVKLDVELSRLADTDATHQLATELYMKYMSFFKTALGK